MKNAVLQVSGATLQCTSKYHSNPLSWGFLEEQLHAYYAEKKRPDETATILDFLQARRGGKTHDCLKKTVLGAEPNSKKPPST
jgi:hypothetical protein